MNVPRKTTTILALGFASLAATTAVHAAEAGKGLYLYGAIGNSNAKFDQAQIDDRLKSAGATGVSSSLDQRYLGLKAMLGYQFQPGLSIEGGYVSLGKFNYNAKTTNVAGGFANGEIKVSGVNAALVKSYPVNPDFNFFAKIGALYAKSEIRVGSALGIAPGAVESRGHGYGPNLGLGFNIIVNPKTDVRFEFERFFRVGDKTTTGKPDIDLLSVGMTYAF